MENKEDIEDNEEIKNNKEIKNNEEIKNKIIEETFTDIIIGSGPGAISVYVFN